MAKFIFYIFFFTNVLALSEPIKTNKQNTNAKPQASLDTANKSQKSLLEQQTKAETVKSLKGKLAKPINNYKHYQVFDNSNKVIGFAYIKINEDRGSDLITVKKYVSLDGDLLNGVKRKLDSLGYYKTDLQGFLKYSEVNNYLNKKWISKMTLASDGINFSHSTQTLGKKTIVTKFPTTDKLVSEQLIYTIDMNSNLKNLKIYNEAEGTIQNVPTFSIAKNNKLNELSVNYGSNKKHRFLYDDELELLEFHRCGERNICYSAKKTNATKKLLDSNPEKAFFDKNL